MCPTLLTLSDGEVRHHEEVVFSADGEKINVLCTTAPVHDAQGQVEGAIEMSVDIKDIGTDGFAAAAEVVGTVVDLPTAP